MADSYITIGSTGVRKKTYDNADADATFSDYVALVPNSTVDIDDIALYPVTPIITAYTPSTTAYLKVTPNAANLAMVVRARTTSDDLIYAGLVTHKIGDTTTIAAADATDLATSKTAIDEIMPESNTHFASTAFHIAADTVWFGGHKEDDATNLSTAADMSDLATGYVLADELDTDVTAHLLSTTFHISATVATDFGGTPNSEATLVTKVNLLRTDMIAHYNNSTVHSAADPINFDLATATTVATDTASAQTLINLLKGYYNSHCAVGDATAADLAAVVVGANAGRAAMLGHYADTATHGGIADAANLATLTAVAAATDLATAQTLITALKDTINIHNGIDDNDVYVTVPAGVALDWPCAGTFFCRTSTSGGTFTTSEFRSA